MLSPAVKEDEMGQEPRYDVERRVSETDIHDEPTEVLERVDVREARPVAEPGYYHREEVVQQPAYLDADRATVREDVSIDHVVERRALLDRVSSIIWFFAGLLEIMLGLRIVLLLLEANRDSGFVRFVYGFTDPFVAPFNGIFNDPASGGAVLDSAAVVAMVVYALIAWAIVRLIWLLLDLPDSGARRSVSSYRRDHV
jgi:YggT family protein